MYRTKKNEAEEVYQKERKNTCNNDYRNDYRYSILGILFSGRIFHGLLIYVNKVTWKIAIDFLKYKYSAKLVLSKQN